MIGTSFQEIKIPVSLSEAKAIKSLGFPVPTKHRRQAFVFLPTKSGTIDARKLVPSIEKNLKSLPSWTSQILKELKEIDIRISNNETNTKLIEEKRNNLAQLGTSVLPPKTLAQLQNPDYFLQHLAPALGSYIYVFLQSYESTHLH